MELLIQAAFGILLALAGTIIVVAGVLFFTLGRYLRTQWGEESPHRSAWMATLGAIIIAAFFGLIFSFEALLGDHTAIGLRVLAATFGFSLICTLTGRYKERIENLLSDKKRERKSREHIRQQNLAYRNSLSAFVRDPCELDRLRKGWDEKDAFLDKRTRAEDQVDTLPSVALRRWLLSVAESSPEEKARKYYSDLIDKCEEASIRKAAAATVQQMESQDLDGFLKWSGWSVGSARDRVTCNPSPEMERPLWQRIS